MKFLGENNFALSIYKKIVHFLRYQVVPAIIIEEKLKRENKWIYLLCLQYLFYSEQMHLGASHHQVRKILDLALSLTID